MISTSSKLLLVFLLFSCSKQPSSNVVNSPTPTPAPTPPPNPAPTPAPTPTNLVYPISRLDSISQINKTTSWYCTNRSFDQIFNVEETLFWGFEKGINSFIPFSVNKKGDYWAERGGYLYTDLTGDGKKDLWSYYYRNPWPTNEVGLHLFSEYEVNSQLADIQYGLTQVRKNVLADINNDKKFEIVLFSSGYDRPPFPGDSIGIFHIATKKYTYLKDDIGYFHGGATGDIDNDGLVDIVAYSGGSTIIPVHPVAYINKGSGVFQLAKSVFSNFTLNDNFYTVELFDIDNDGKLDLFLGTHKTLLILPGKSGKFDRASAISLPIEGNQEIIDIAFFDFDMDGKMDVLTMSNIEYKGFVLSLYLQKQANQFVEQTQAYFDFPYHPNKNGWIKWIRLFDYDKDGDIDVVCDGVFGSALGYNPNNKLHGLWRNDEGKFKWTIRN